MSELDAVELADRLSTRSPGGIAEQIGQLIEERRLAPDSRLPTVRDLAQELGVSVGTIAQAWSILRENGLVETRRRGGTRVLDPVDRGFSGFQRIDLISGSPDPVLLPDLSEAIHQALGHSSINTWSRDPITDDLRRAALNTLPFTPQSALAANGGTEALWLALRAATEPGDAVAVETPAAPGFLDVLRNMGLRPVEVTADDDGPLPKSLTAALDAGASAFVYSPVGAFAERGPLSEERSDQLRDVLEQTTATIVEDDALGALINEPAASLCAAFPERSLRVMAYCRTYGIDVRTSVLAGSEDLVTRAGGLRADGLASVSRILQQTLAGLITGAKSRRGINFARRSYARRKQVALEAIAKVGLTAHSGANSWNIWIEVPEEHQAALALSAQGVVVGVSSDSRIQPREQQALRMTITQLPEDPKRLAELAQLLRSAADGTLNKGMV